MQDLREKEAEAAKNKDYDALDKLADEVYDAEEAFKKELEKRREE